MFFFWNLCSFFVSRLFYVLASLKQKKTQKFVRFFFVIHVKTRNKPICEISERESNQENIQIIQNRKKKKSTLHTHIRTCLFLKAYSDLLLRVWYSHTYSKTSLMWTPTGLSQNVQINRVIINEGAKVKNLIRSPKTRFVPFYW